jgi:hypothetical protein
MALQKLLDSMTSTTSAGESEQLTMGSNPEPRLSVVRPGEIDLDAALQELAEIIEAEDGMLIP